MKPKKLTASQQKQANVFITKARKHFSANEFAVAGEFYRKLYSVIKDPRCLQLQAVCEYRLQRYAEAIRLSELALKKFQEMGITDIHTLENLSEINGVAGFPAVSQKYGRLVLEEKDRQALNSSYASSLLPTSPIPSGSKKVISFSLYGQSPRYCENALLNIEAAKTLYPDFTCRFYLDDSVSDHLISRIKAAGGEVVEVDETTQQLPGTMWRFLALDDPDAAIVLCRDCDSIVSEREKRVVDEWLSSDHSAHIIRDFYSHCELILAGLFGLKQGLVANVKATMLNFLKENKVVQHTDQNFLRMALWPCIKEHALVHDRCFGFGTHLASIRLPEPKDSLDHIGSNMGSSKIDIKVDAQDGLIAKWQFAHEPGEAFAHYESVIKNKQWSAFIPYHYALKIQSKQMRIDWSVEVPKS